MKPELTLDALIHEAGAFCEAMSLENHLNLIGVTDGKAVGTYVEHRFQAYLDEKYIMGVGNSAKGIDLPSVNTDIKVTSLTQPQSSCPFQNARQKVYGLGYHLLVFVYEKTDSADSCRLSFTHCALIHDNRTSDYTITKRLREMAADGANIDDMMGFLQDKNVPGDEIVLRELAEEILRHCPEQGYLTVSNALQWRLKYTRVIELDNQVSGVVNYEWKERIR